MEKGCRCARWQYTCTDLEGERKSGRNLEPNLRSLLAGVWSELTLGIAAVPSPICPSGVAPKGYGSGAREETGGDVQKESGGIIFTAAFKRGSSQHLTAKRQNHYLMPVPYQHFLLRWSKKNYWVTPKCSNALLKTWTSQFWCWSEIHTVK